MYGMRMRMRMQIDEKGSYGSVSAYLNALTGIIEPVQPLCKIHYCCLIYE